MNLIYTGRFILFRLINLSTCLIQKNIHSVAVAISGGVDSAVSAYLLKEKGFQVKGVFMTNWDPLDEGTHCSIDADREDALYVCEKLKIPFYERNFVKEYWNYVFLPLLKSYELGATPNPDILCNRFVKFNMFSKEVLGSRTYENQFKELSLNSNIRADAIATGHYCRSSFGTFLEDKHNQKEAQLLRSIDCVKDQSFWLSTISHEHLRNCMFPIGDLLKPQVKDIAHKIGLSRIANRRESMGMCFIGKRRFADFIDSYLKPKAGLFKDLESGIVLDEHLGVHHFTLGQRAPITGVNGPFYIAKMDSLTQTIYVVNHPAHPSLFMRKCWCGPMVWINSEPFKDLESKVIHFQWQNKWRPINCSLKGFSSIAHAAVYLKCFSKRGYFQNNAELIELIDETVEENRYIGPCLSVILEEPMRCISSGQWAAFYYGDICLGGAMICGSISLWEEGQNELYTKWNYSDFELNYSDLNNNINSNNNYKCIQ